VEDSETLKGARGQVQGASESRNDLNSEHEKGRKAKDRTEAKDTSTLGIATVLSFAVCPSTFVPEFFLRPR
jgi:hypothetical protein